MRFSLQCSQFFFCFGGLAIYIYIYIYIRRKNMCQIGCADHSAVATPDKGSKPKKDIYIHIYIYIYTHVCVHMYISCIYEELKCKSL